MLLAHGCLVPPFASLSGTMHGAFSFRHAVSYARGRSLRQTGQWLQQSTKDKEEPLDESETRPVTFVPFQARPISKPKPHPNLKPMPLVFKPTHPVKKTSEQVVHHRPKGPASDKADHSKDSHRAARQPYSPHVIELAEKLIQQGKFGKASLSPSTSSSSSSRSVSRHMEKSPRQHESFKPRQREATSQSFRQEERSKKYQGSTMKTYYHKPSPMNSDDIKSSDVKSGSTKTLNGKERGTRDMSRSFQQGSRDKPGPWTNSASHGQDRDANRFRAKQVTLEPAEHGGLSTMPYKKKGMGPGFPKHKAQSQRGG